MELAGLQSAVTPGERIGPMKLRVEGAPADGAWIGRPAMGKTVPRGTDIEVCRNVLRRAVREMEDREAEGRADAITYYVVVDDQWLLAEHPDDNQLRDLLDAVRHRGPAVDVRLQRPAS